jgi:integrase
MQQGSIFQTVRKQGPNVWSFRWSEKSPNGRRVYRKRAIGRIEQYPDANAARATAGALLAQINAYSNHNDACRITVTEIRDHFEQKELRSGDSFPSFATVKTYRGHIRKWVKPRAGDCQTPNDERHPPTSRNYLRNAPGSGVGAYADPTRQRSPAK